MKILNWAILSIFLLSGMLNAQLPLENNAKIYRVTANDGPFSWVVHGVLYRVTFSSGVEGCYLYCGRDGQKSVVSDDIKAFTAMVRQEIEGANNTENFVKMKFSNVALSFFAKSFTFIINDHYIETYKS